jgi:uncharacterized protein YjbI with pentapeptide repeats
MDALFEPPKYLASLIAAVNDGAKSAQTGVLGFTLVGLYLLATAFSTTDEDLLLQHTMSVSQIGVQVPVVFSLAIAPAVFLFLHAYTLIRYDMLAANLRQFRTDLQVSVPREADRERCRQLLANVEFIQVRTAPRNSALYSRVVYPLIAWLLLAGFPVGTLIVVQVSSLRYQSNAVLRTQQVVIGLDLVLLAWFFYRQRRRREPSGNARYLNWVQYCITLLATTVVILGVELFYLNVPDANEYTVRSDVPIWTEVYQQPLDLGLCPALHWGCRHLTVDHRTLVGHVWNTQAITELRSAKGRSGEQGDINKSLAGIEGVFLRDRTLRFADFSESRLYAADMIEADLSGANLSKADLSEANLPGADLSGADLSKAHLSWANLSNADLSGAYLSGADLSKAHLSGADLSKANLSGADLSGADLSETDLPEANRFSPNPIVIKTKITQAQLNQACGDPSTKLPPGLTIAPCSK